MRRAWVTLAWHRDVRSITLPGAWLPMPGGFTREVAPVVAKVRPALRAVAP